jgi:hypothetical protein
LLTAIGNADKSESVFQIKSNVKSGEGSGSYIVEKI